jgi:hypothetical protein
VSNSFDNLTPQAFPQQNTPLAFRWYNSLAVGDTSQPGRMSPFLQDADGNLLMTLAGPGSVPLALPDDADNVAEVATNTRIPTVARLYGLDASSNDNWDRLRTDDDDLEASDAESLPALRVMNRPRLYQGTNGQWVRARSNDSPVIFASAARTATVSSATQENTNFRGGQFIINVTAITATPSVVFSIEGRDLASATFFTLLDSVAITGVGQTILRVYPGLFPVVANETVNDLLPWLWRITATHADADSITYSVGANLML